MIVVAVGALLLFIVAFFIVIFSLVSFLTGAGRRHSTTQRSQSKNAILAPVRKRFNAENLRASRLGEMNVFRPTLVFDYGRTIAKLRHYGSPWNRQNKQTVLETELPIPSGCQLMVASRREFNDPGFSHFEIGDEEFEKQFAIRANESSFALRLLSDPVKWKMAEIAALQNGAVRFELDGSYLKVSCDQWFGRGQDLLDFVQGGLELFDQLMLHKDDGVDFTGEGQAAVMKDLRCPVCSSEITEDMVVCKRCKTPHCEECWEYIGKCAMFGCMETRFIRVVQHEV